MIRILPVFILIVAFHAIASAQDKPTDGDSPEYSQAYELLFDSRARALKAVGLLLPPGKTLATLTARELSLLCRAYNELGQSEKQLDAAKELWRQGPGKTSATRWMCNSLLNIYAYSDDSTPLMEFVDSALAQNQGNKRELLILKATAILGREKGMLDAEKRVAVSDLLVDAYKSGPALPIFDDVKFSEPDSPAFIDYDSPFGSFFSVQEREALKVRMKNAREIADKERTK